MMDTPMTGPPRTSFAKAVDQALRENPELYAEYRGK